MATLRSHQLPATATFTAVADIARDQLREFLAKPPRAANDWSIHWTSRGDDDGDELERFLNSADERILEWPLAKPRRQQVHFFIDQAGLPVKHSTRRKGSPTY